ncbi:MAG: putative glycoside hydrolase, partial [Ardenticatenia bacterium]|nr:putative glycoside hydrolase [Ardenticatenia bacterium]
VRASTPGYELAEIALRADSQAIRLRSLRPRVHVVDARTGMPVAGAVVVWNGQWARTDDRGVVFLPAVPQGPLTMKRAAYWRAVVSSPETATLVRLEPIHVRGLYLAFGFLNRPRTVIEAYLDRAAQAGLNTVVIDAKGDRGYLAWESAHPDARLNGVNSRSAISAAEFLEMARRRGFYVIARVVVFKDNPLAEAQPERAVRRADGTIWRDREGLGWADPRLVENWNYNITLARELAEMGFDEVNLDYIRFPSDGNLQAIAWGEVLTAETRTATISRFLQAAHEALRPTPALMSGDVFGLTPAVYHSDMNIGQTVETMAPYMDIFCPMSYPATYIPGNMGLTDPVRQPYETVYRATAEAVKRSVSPVRPWLQAYSWAGVVYDADELYAQIRAAEEAGAIGWLFWNAGGSYDLLFEALETQ